MWRAQTGVRQTKGLEVKHTHTHSIYEKNKATQDSGGRWAAGSHTRGPFCWGKIKDFNSIVYTGHFFVQNLYSWDQGMQINKNANKHKKPFWKNGSSEIKQDKKRK